MIPLPSRPLGPFAMRALRAWFLVSRPLTMGVRAALFDPEGRVCLVRHGYVAGWHLPGGGVEVGEDALGALAREVREETGIALAAPPALHGIFHAAPRDHVLVYLACGVEAPPPRPPDREIAEAGFFAPDALPEGTTRPTRARLDEIASGSVPATTW